MTDKKKKPCETLIDELALKEGESAGFEASANVLLSASEQDVETGNVEEAKQKYTKAEKLLSEKAKIEESKAKIKAKIKEKGCSIKGE